MKRPITISVLLFAAVLVAPFLSLGQASIYSQYMFNGLAINPAYAGHDEMLSMTFLGRAQATGVEGNPKTQTFSAHTPIKRNRVGLGLQLYHETIAVTEQTSLYASYSYRLKYRQYRLSLGLQAGINFLNSQYSELFVNDPGDPAFGQDVREVTPNFGSGVLLTGPDFYAGMSFPQMMAISKNIIEEQPFFLYGGYVWTITTFLKLKPSTLLKYESGKVVEWNINAHVLYNDLIWLGASYRPNNAFVLMFELLATEQLTIGYAYDATLNPLRTVDSGSHELMLNFRFQFSQKGVISPRYF